MDDWQLKTEKSAEIRLAISMALERAEQDFQKRLAEERRAFVDEAEKIAMEIIEKELKKENKPSIAATADNDNSDDLFAEDFVPQKNEAENPTTKAPKKQHVDFNEENIKIIRQLAEIKKQDAEEKHEKLIKDLELEEAQRKKIEEGKKKVEAAWKNIEEMEWHGTF